METEKTKKDKSIRPSVAIVSIFVLVVIALIVSPILQHRQYLKFMSELSDVTTRLDSKSIIVCEADGVEWVLDEETSADIYRKLIYSELERRTKRNDEIAQQGFTIRYGSFATLILAPAEYNGEACVYVDYHSGKIDRTYFAPHLKYEMFKRIVEAGR